MTHRQGQTSVAEIADHLYRLIGNAGHIVNPGDRVEIRHEDLERPATGTSRGAATGSHLHLIELDGTGALVTVPESWLHPEAHR